MKKTVVYSIFVCLCMLTAVQGLDSYYEDAYLKSVDREALKKEIADARQLASAILPQWEDAAAKDGILSSRLLIVRRLLKYIENNVEDRNQPEGLLYARRGARELRQFVDYFRRWLKVRQDTSLPLKSWNLTDFGGDGNGESDNTAAFSRMTAQIARYPEFRHEVIIPEGTYLFAEIIKADNRYFTDVMEPERRESMFYHTTKHAHIRLRNLRNVTFKGEGKVLFLFGDSAAANGVNIEGCENVRIENIAVDYPNLPFSQGTIVSLNPQKNTLVMKKDPGYPAPDSPRFLNTLSRRFWAFHPETGEFVWNAGTKFLGKVSPLGNDCFEVEVGRSTNGRRPLGGLVAGQRLAIIARYNGVSSFFVRASAFTTLDGVTVYSAPAGAFISWTSYDSHFLNCRILPRPGSGRLLSSNGDGIHVNSDIIGPVVKNCEFTRMYDDAVNIYMKAEEIRPGFELLEDGKKAVIPTWNYFDGAEIAVMDSSTGKIRGEATCLSVRPTARRAPRKIVFEFDKPLPVSQIEKKQLSAEERFAYTTGGLSGVRFGDALLCLSRSGIGAVLSGNRFGPNHGHGVNVQTPHALVENNQMNGVGASGVQLSSLCSWNEASVPRNVLIRNNKFLRCGFGLNVFYELKRRDKLAVYAPIRAVEVKNNLFENSRHSAVRLRNVSDIIFQDNVFRGNVQKLVAPSCGNVQWKNSEGGHSMKTLVWENGGSRLVCSAKNGAVTGFEVMGKNLVSAAKRAFQLRFLRESDGEYLFLDDSGFSEFHAAGNRLTWSGCTMFPGLVFSCEIRKGKEGAFRFRPKVSGIPAGVLLDFIQAPHISVPMGNELFFPYSEGVMVSAKERKKREELHLAFPPDTRTGYYPGVCQMQFMASYRKGEENGLYFAADDYTHGTKIIEFSADGDGTLGLRIENSCGEENAGKDFELPFELLLRPFSGGWRDACEIYRNWVKSDPAMKGKFAMPQWMEDSPVTIIYPVRGSGAIHDAPNAFLPYENAFPRLMELAAGFESRIMPLLMRWDHNGPWLPPYYWPPVGGVESFRRFRDMLHEAGHLLGVYGSGTTYTMKSLVNGYSGRERYENEGIGQITLRGPRGERSMAICKAIRDGEGLCVGERKSRKILAEQVEILAREKVDFFQMMDQNLGGASFACYAKKHSHPPVPGRWQTAVMRTFLEELNDRIRKLDSEMILGTECAAAGPYLSAMPFNDLRDLFALRLGIPVPAYQYIFHAYANNFFGNQCVVWSCIDCAKCPDNLQFRLARAFCSGEMLTVTLRDSGEIDWGAAADWSKPAPAQAPVIALVKTFNALRRRYPQYLMRGEMVKSEHKLECGKYVLPLLQGDSQEYPAIASGAWRAPDGSIAEFFVNFREEEAEFTLDGKKIKLPPLSVHVLEPR